MNRQISQLKELLDLYRLQSFGYEYFSTKKSMPVSEAVNVELPDDLEQLKEFVYHCHLCDLAKRKTNYVFGEGNVNAKLMFVGEGPGQREDELGRPFVGRSGELLTKIIETTLEMKREDVYIANVVKCRPPGNRVPNQEEADRCLPYLIKQISLIQPKVIVTLGATAYKYLTGDMETPISKIRGEVLEFANTLLVPTFHPSFLLRNPSAKRFVYYDMKKVKALL